MERIPTILCLVLASIIFDVGDSQEDGSVCSNGFCVPANYTRLEKPPGHTKVSLSLIVSDVLAVSERDFTVSIFAYMITSWTESRIYYTGDDDLNYASSGGVDMEMTFLDRLWSPQVMVSQVKTYEVANDANRQGGLKITKAKNGFKIIRLEGVYITFLCPMRFEWYPMDAHDCYLYFGFNKDRSKITLENLVMHYNPQATNVVLDFSVSMRNLSLEESSVITFGRSDYSNRGFVIRLERNKLRYVHSYYTPAGLLVIISWASFLIPPEIVAGRMSLLVTLSLCLINIFLSTTKELPCASITALSFYMIASIHFVSWSFMEYTYLLCKIRPTILWSRKRREKRSLHEVIKLSPQNQRRSSADVDQQQQQQQQQHRDPHHAMESQSPEMHDSIRHHPSKSIFFSSRPRDRHRTLVDDFSLIFFPSLFLLFNLAYWIVVLVGSSNSRGVTPEQMNPWDDLDRMTREIHIQDA